MENFDMSDINNPLVNDIYSIIYEDSKYIHNYLCGVYKININNHSLERNLNVYRVNMRKILKYNLENSGKLPDKRVFDTISHQFYNICLRYNEFPNDKKEIFSDLFYTLISSPCEQFPEYNFTPSYHVSF